MMPMPPPLSQLPSLIDSNALEVTLGEAADFTISPKQATTMVSRGSLMVSAKPQNVSLQTLREEGFGGWWEPQERPFGSISLGEFSVLLVASTPWDGSSVGRVGAILDNTPRSQKVVVTTFLKGFDPLGSVVGECAAGISRKTVPSWGYGGVLHQNGYATERRDAGDQCHGPKPPPPISIKAWVYGGVAQ